MFEKLFERFRAKQSKAERVSEDMEREFDRIKLEYSKIATSDLYKLIIEYFLTKIELNRDMIEEKNPLIKEDRYREVELKAEIKAMKGFITDMEDMKEQYEAKRSR